MKLHRFLMILCLSGLADLSAKGSSSTKAAVTFFSQYVKDSELILNRLSEAKKYWSRESFSMSLPMHRRHLAYSLYFNSYKSLAKSKLEMIEDAEIRVMHLLGICLYGLHCIKEDSSDLSLSSAVNPLFCFYGIPQNTDNMQKLHEDLCCIYKKMNQSLSDSIYILEENDKPSFVREHWFGLSCGAVVLALSCVAYQNYKQEIPKFASKSCDVVGRFTTDYAVTPFKKIYEFLWEGKIEKLPKIKHGQSISAISDSRWLLIADLARPLNKKIEEINQNREEIINVVNGTVDFIDNNIMKSILLNAQLATIAPVFIVGYLSSKALKSGYNRLIIHDGWHATMKQSVREIDRLINFTISDNVSFVQCGQLYMIVLNMKQYLNRLPNNELIMIREDLSDLISFKLNCAQKKSVLERMYRTYAFLK